MEPEQQQQPTAEVDRAWTPSPRAAQAPSQPTSRVDAMHNALAGCANLTDQRTSHGRCFRQPGYGYPPPPPSMSWSPESREERRRHGPWEGRRPSGPANPCHIRPNQIISNPHYEWDPQIKYTMAFFRKNTYADVSF